MNAITKAALIFNAVKIPYEFFMKLCDSYSPDELFSHESILQELGLSEHQQSRITLNRSLNASKSSVQDSFTQEILIILRSSKI